MRKRKRIRQAFRPRKDRGENRCPKPKCKKVVFPSRETAEEAARRINESEGRERMRAYKGECGRWHLSRILTPEEIRKKYVDRHRRRS